MISSNIKERWRAAELENSVENALKKENVWLDSCWLERKNPKKSIIPIVRKLALLTVDKFNFLDLIPKELSHEQLIFAFFNGFDILINRSLTGEVLIKTDYAIISLARDFAANIESSVNQDLIMQSECVIKLASHWDDHIRKLKQSSHGRFIV